MFRAATIPGIVLAALAAATSARADDGAAARQIVQALSAGAEGPAALREPLDRARDAIERATRMRAAGDEAHAKAADGLALEWAETARDLARAIDAERAAGDRRREAMAKQAQVERDRALIEAELAHVGRLRKEIEDAPAPGRAAPGERRAAARAGGAAPGGPKGATKAAPRDPTAEGKEKP